MWKSKRHEKKKTVVDHTDDIGVLTFFSFVFYLSWGIPDSSNEVRNSKKGSVLPWRCFLTIMDWIVKIYDAQELFLLRG